jgi:hypothetical protein
MAAQKKQRGARERSDLAGTRAVKGVEGVLLFPFFLSSCSFLVRIQRHEDSNCLKKVKNPRNSCTMIYFDLLACIIGDVFRISDEG